MSDHDSAIPDDRIPAADPAPLEPSGDRTPADSLADATQEPANDPWREFSALGQYLMNHNPFYLVSAAFVLFGLGKAFQAEKSSFDPWLLASVLVIYLVLVALAAVVVIRWGGVWDDGRTMLLTVVLLLFVLPIALDRIVLWQNEVGDTRGPEVLAGGVLLAVAISELLLRGLRLGLGGAFRFPYYGVLLLMYLYPLLPQQLLDRIGPEPARWALFAFPAVAGLVTLTLLPLAWRGPQAIARSFAPWPWPYFPWSVFMMLGVGVVIRSYMLAISFDASEQEEVAFGTYWLVPFAYAVLLIFFEAARSVQCVPAMQTAVMFALITPVLAVEAGDLYSPVYHEFLVDYSSLLGPPPLLALAGSVLFLAYARVRGVSWAANGAAFPLFLMVFCERWTTDGLGWAAGRDWVAVTLAGWLLATGPLSLRRTLASGAALFLAVVLHLDRYPAAPSSATWLIAGHLVLLYGFAVSLVFQEAMARRLRWVMTAASLGASGFACLIDPLLGLHLAAGKAATVQAWAPAGVGLGYTLAWLVMLALLAWLARELAFGCGAMGQCVVLLAWTGAASAHLVRGTALEEGWSAVVLGAVIFGVGMAISAVKARRLRIADYSPPAPVLRP